MLSRLRYQALVFRIISDKCRFETLVFDIDSREMLERPWELAFRDVQFQDWVWVDDTCV